jgi:RNA polymerase sigma-70 factor (ECF subfamily)
MTVQEAVLEPRAAEQDLITMAQRGDRQSFGDLVRLHRAGVVNVVFRMCGDEALAEDAAQEAFIRAWTKLPDYQPRAPFRSWLYRIATNAARDMLRRQRPTVDVNDLPLASPGSGPEAEVSTSERAQQVQDAVLALPDASRTVLILREYEGLSYREISDVLEIPMGTVMSRLNYARSALRDRLANVLEEAS